MNLFGMEAVLHICSLCLQDKCSIFSGNSPRQERGYILASEGCKVLRIQKKAFFEEASDKAIRHAKALAELEKLELFLTTLWYFLCNE